MHQRLNSFHVCGGIKHLESNQSCSADFPVRLHTDAHRQTHMHVYSILFECKNKRLNTASIYLYIYIYVYGYIYGLKWTYLRSVNSLNTKYLPRSNQDLYISLHFYTFSIKQTWLKFTDDRHTLKRHKQNPNK